MNYRIGHFLSLIFFSVCIFASWFLMTFGHHLYLYFLVHHYLLVCLQFSCQFLAVLWAWSSPLLPPSSYLGFIGHSEFVDVSFSSYLGKFETDLFSPTLVSIYSCIAPQFTDALFSVCFIWGLMLLLQVQELFLSHRLYNLLISSIFIVLKSAHLV